MVLAPTLLKYTRPVCLPPLATGNVVFELGVEQILREYLRAKQL
jgi:hypothetical protein